MQPIQIDSIGASPAYRRLIASRRRFSFTLTALMILIYYGFILFVALAPHVLARPLYAGATTNVGIVAGVGIILVAVGMSGWYVMRTNRTLDPLMSAFLANVRHGE
jgi:uncharacterized membrane protein (DUF485 family)